ncbi:hypothetical protein D3C78_1638390 [compost metagenome]
MHLRMSKNRDEQEHLNLVGRTRRDRPLREGLVGMIQAKIMPHHVADKVAPKPQPSIARNIALCSDDKASYMLEEAVYRLVNSGMAR